MAEYFKTVYVIYPRGLRTGGPEALHQLVSSLRSMGQEAFLVATPETRGALRVDEYAKYDAPEAERIEDRSDNAVVVPETFLEKLRPIRHARRVCWWLSIDKSRIFRFSRFLTSTSRSERTLLETARNFAFSASQPVYRELLKMDDLDHLAQSSYAWAFISSRFAAVPSILSDYTPVDDFDVADNLIEDRGRSIAFNPVKGQEIIDQVRKISLAKIDWRPIQGMTRPEVVRTLATTSIYLDLGSHPGKDRLPREAALAGALTVVARRGAGAFFSDVPIPWEHKITPGRDIAARVAESLPALLDRLADEVPLQNSYRDKIRAEQAQFDREVADIFLHRRLGKDTADYVEPQHEKAPPTKR